MYDSESFREKLDQVYDEPESRWKWPLMAAMGTALAMVTAYDVVHVGSFFGVLVGAILGTLYISIGYSNGRRAEASRTARVFELFAARVEALKEAEHERSH